MPLVVSKECERSFHEYRKQQFKVNRFESHAEVNPLSEYFSEFEVIISKLEPELEEIYTEIKQETSLSSILMNLEKFYILENTEEIVEFIGTHTFLVNILFEVPRRIKNIFGESIEMHLELHKDPEEDFEGLFIIVKTNLPPKASLDLLDKFDEKWWLNVDNNIRNLLEVMVRPT